MTDGLTLQVTQDEPVHLRAHIQCERGSLLALVGPSGAGKTTLLRMIAGLTTPADGHIHCAGQTWLKTSTGTGPECNVAVRERRIGFVFQQYALFPHLTAQQNVEQSCRHLRRGERRQKARYWLDKVNLSGLEHRRPDQLSGGQQQRVGLARALAREPNILLLDEPFSAVDRATRDRLYQELAQLRRELSIPAILVTHDLDEAIVLSDQLCMLSQGVTLQSGPVAEVISRPASVLVARLVGIKNVFRATVLKVMADGSAMIEWRGNRLQVASHNGFHAGQLVHWCIPQSHLILHRRDRPSRGERENPISGHVADMVPLGDNVLLSIEVARPNRPPVFLSVPVHVAQRNGIETGVSVGFSLLAESIHLMKPDRLGRSRVAR
jgi:molybdate transport system ATP-binding protein